MKIMHVLQSSTYSGAENVVCQIIGMFKESEYQMIYCSPDGPIRETVRDKEINFHPLTNLTVSNLRKAVESVKPDIIHAHDRKASLCAALACPNLPIVSHMHVNNPSNSNFDIKSLLYSFSCRRYRHIFWVSKSAFEEFRYLNNKMSSKSSVLYNVIDIDKLKQRIDEDKNDYNFDAVMLGRLTYQKDPIRGLKVMQKVIASNPSVQFAIIGSGVLEEQVVLELKKDEYKGKVKYLGFMDNPMKLLHNSKAMLMTSRFEGTPMSVLEAMALGVPVISTPVDGIKDLIRNGVNGYLSNNDDELAEKLYGLIVNDKLRSELSNNTQQIAAELMNIESYKEKLIEVYSKCI